MKQLERKYRKCFPGSVTFALVGFLLLKVCYFAGASGNTGSPSGEVTVGVITYSYRSMPDQSLPALLDYITRSGLHSVELMGRPLEQYLAGLPAIKDSVVSRQWRLSASMDGFKAVREMFEKRGVKIDIVKMGSLSWSDEEIEYAFNVCKTLGARGISMEISEAMAQRMAPFAEKHGLPVIMHNHSQAGDPDFSFDKILSCGPGIMLNLDIGHYYGATGTNPVALIERLHDRIASLHVKDKTGPDGQPPNTDRPIGQGSTPVVEILRLIKKNNWPITCDIEMEYAIPEGSDAVTEVIKCAAFIREALR